MIVPKNCFNFSPISGHITLVSIPLISTLNHKASPITGHITLVSIHLISTLNHKASHRYQLLDGMIHICLEQYNLFYIKGNQAAMLARIAFKALPCCFNKVTSVIDHVMFYKKRKKSTLNHVIWFSLKVWLTLMLISLPSFF